MSMLLQPSCSSRVWSSSAFPVALAVALCVFKQVEDLVSNLGRNVKSVSELAILEFFSEQGEGLLAKNTESFLSERVIFSFQNYLQAFKNPSEYSRGV